MDDSFYVTLPSNVESDYFENTVANFKTKLASRLELKGIWEVGLSLISYTNSWYNIMNNESIHLRYFDADPKKTADSHYIYAGRYDTIDDLLDYIKYRLSKINSNNVIPGLILPELGYDKKTRLVFIKLGLYKNRFVYPEFSDNLCTMLGFDKTTIDSIAGTKLIEYSEELNTKRPEERSYWEPPHPPTTKTKLYAVRPFNLNMGFHSMYVYCDIVKPSLIGNSNSQLLRYVEVPPNYNFGDQIVLTYPDTHYIPIISNDIETVEIDIREDTGYRVPFEFGRTIVVLHFRKTS